MRCPRDLSLLEDALEGLTRATSAGREEPRRSLERALEIAAQNPASRYWGVELQALLHEADVG